MAHIGKWGTFIHIPKCGGAWVRYHLRENFGRGEECGPTHSWPHPYQKKKNRAEPLVPQAPFFTFIRHPATWLRSFYHYSGTKKWREAYENDHGYGHWAMIVFLTEEFKNENWEDFATRVCNERSGLVSWFFRSYMFPGLKVGRMEDQPFALQKFTGLWIEAEPVNTQSDLPDIPGWLWNKIERSEQDIVNTFYSNYAENDYYWEHYEYPSLVGIAPAFLKGKE